MKNAVLLDQMTLGQDVSLAALSQQFDHWQSYEQTHSSEVVERCLQAQVIITNKVLITSEHLYALPRLKLIAVTATGTNNIDCDTAKKLGITVINVTGYGTDAVAQHTMSLLLQLAGKSSAYQSFINNNQWQKSPFFSHVDIPTMELSGKTIGIIGYGDLGQATALLAQAFGMSVLIGEHKGAQVVRQGRVSFNDLLEQSDVISLHCPLTSHNANMIDAPALKRMKNSALLINTARGPLIDESALVATLNQGDIAGAALDVLSQEPPVTGNVLLDYQGDNLIITPHIAWAAVEARQRLINILAEKIKRYL